MKILYLTTILLISNLFFWDIVIPKELVEKKQLIERRLIKANNITQADNTLENVPKLELDLIKTKVEPNKDIFSYKNIELNRSKNNFNNFKLIGLVEIEGTKSILISFTGEIKSFKEGEIIDNKFKIKEISFKPAFVIFQNNNGNEKIYLN
tara:strand:- start:129 stop:581 length:453 start_codon:yes stop_codon:yes gene_type:complete